MIGEITDFDDATQEGVITDEKGAVHGFDLVGWRGRGLPGPGLAVDFDIREGRAVQVFNARIKQQKARRVVSAPLPDDAFATEGPGTTASPDKCRGNKPRWAWWLGGLVILLSLVVGLLMS